MSSDPIVGRVVGYYLMAALFAFLGAALLVFAVIGNVTALPALACSILGFFVIALWSPHIIEVDRGDRTVRILAKRRCLQEPLDGLLEIFDIGAAARRLTFRDGARIWVMKGVTNWAEIRTLISQNLLSST